MLGRRRDLGTLAVALFGVVLITSVVRAAGVTAEELISIAEGQFGMTCAQVDPSLEQCSKADPSGQWTADIEPASGLVTALTTGATQFVAPLDQAAVSMMDGLHVPTCADRAGVESFVAKVAAMVASGTVGPQAVGNCTMQGDLQAAPRSYVYTIRSTVLGPPSPTPTLQPTPTPTPVPSIAPTLPASSTATLSPTSTPGTTEPASQTAEATPSSTDSPEPTPTPSASATSEAEVAGIQGTPAPSSAGRGAPIAGLGFATSVAAPSEVRFDAVSLSASALLAVLLLLLIAFPGELFNSTVESNYEEIAGWLRRARIRGLAAVWRGPIGVILLLGLGALTYSLLDPACGTDAASLASYVGLLIGLVVVLAAFELPGLLMHRRRTGELGSLRALPWTLVAGGVCVLISRLAGFEPGYLYGVLLGVVFRRPQATDDDGRQAAAGAVWTLLTALAAWLALGWLRATVADAGFLRVAGETALAAVVVAGLEAVAFGMMPFRFLNGAAVRAWSRIAWALLFGAGAFAFVHVLIGPQSGYLAELAPNGLIAALAVFVAFAAMSFAVWGYFRFRPARR
jgi:hypothetical protein